MIRPYICVLPPEKPRAHERLHTIMLAGRADLSGLTTARSSHRQIFKSTAIVGLTQVANIILGLARTKVLALLLGPVGIGLSGTYLTVTGFVGGITGLGLGNSGVRHVAESAATGDPDKLAHTILALRRASLLSGVLGLVVAALLCNAFSRTTFGDDSRSGELALMSISLLFAGISAGQIALLQGLRRLADMGRAQVGGTLVGTAAGVLLVWYFRERGIVLFLLANSLCTAVFSWWYARKVPLPPLRVSWRDSLLESRGLMTLGVAFVIQNLLLGLSGYLGRIIIIQDLGLTAVGIYTATWTLSTYYVGMVLRAMGADFYPRLTGAAQSHPLMWRLVNEQIEMGLLIAVPGVLGVLALAPWMLHLFYSRDFVSGEGIIRWQVLGVFVQVFSWPVSSIIIAKGHRRLFVLSEVVNALGTLGFLLLGVHLWRLDGTGIAFFLATLTSAAYSFIVCQYLVGFSLSGRNLKILGLSCLVVGVGFFLPQLLPGLPCLVLGLLLALAAGCLCLLLLQNLLGITLAGLIRSKFVSFRQPIRP